MLDNNTALSGRESLG